MVGNTARSKKQLMRWYFKKVQKTLNQRSVTVTIVTSECVAKHTQALTFTLADFVLR